MNTRDTLGFAIKATYGEVFEQTDKGSVSSKYGGKCGILHEREIWKDPITDDGTKKSARGLVTVLLDEKGEYYLKDMCSPHEVEAETNQLKPVFKDGKLLVRWTLDEIRERIKKG